MSEFDASGLHEYAPETAAEMKTTMLSHKDHCPPIPRPIRHLFAMVLFCGAFGMMIMAGLANNAADNKNKVFRAFFDSNEQAIVIVTDDFKVYQWSRGMEILTGWTKDDVEGQTIEFLMPLPMYDIHHKGMQKAFTKHAKLPGMLVDSEPTVIRCDVLRKDGEKVPVRISVRMFKDEDEQVYSSAAFDHEDGVQYFNARTGRHSGGSASKIKAQAEEIKKEADKISGSADEDRQAAEQKAEANSK